MTTDRPYRAALPDADARQEGCARARARSSTRHVVDAFVEVANRRRK